MFAYLGDELHLMQGQGEWVSQIHLHSQVCPCRAAELMGHLVGFSVTLGGFKVDGVGKDGLFRYSHQIGALLFKDRRSVLQFVPVENAVGRTAAAAKF